MRAGVSVFEWRLLQLEEQRDDHERRVRAIESEIGKLNEKLAILPRLEEGLKRLYEDRYKNLWGLVVATVIVVGSVIGSHIWFK